MPDITKNIEVDEHYTITSDVVESGTSSDFLKGAIVGSTFSRLANMPKVIRVPVEPTNKTISLKRAIRDTPTVIVETEKIVKVNQKIGEIPSKLLVTELKIRTDKKKLEPEYTVPTDPIAKTLGVKRLKSARLIELEESQEKFGFKLTAKDTSKKSKPTLKETKELYREFLEAIGKKKPKDQEFISMRKALAPRKEGRMTYSQLKEQSRTVE